MIVIMMMMREGRGEGERKGELEGEIEAEMWRRVAIALHFGGFTL